MLEKYRSLVETGKGRTEQAALVKEQLLSADPTNARLSFYHVAVIDFESACYDPDENQSAQQTAYPLIKYCEQFGEKDKANLWRLQMIIAQVFYDEDLLTEALDYAEAALQSAPALAQPEITTAIKNIKTELSRDQIDHKRQQKIDKISKRRQNSRLNASPSL